MTPAPILRFFLFVEEYSMEENSQGHKLADITMWLSACLLSGSLGAGIPEFWRKVWLLGGGLAFFLMASMKAYHAFRSWRTEQRMLKALRHISISRLERTIDASARLTGNKQEHDPFLRASTSGSLGSCPSIFTMCSESCSSTAANSNTS